MIAVIDCGVGNLMSVHKALEFIGCEAQVSSDAEFIKSCDAVVLPGVGAFADAMKQLRSTGMDRVVKHVIKDGTPFLGICLGLQLLYEYSEEGGEVEGLGIMSGVIRRFPSNMELKIPHMGWNCLSSTEGKTLFKGLEALPYVYFVHSYYLESSRKENVCAECEYGVSFDAAIEQQNVFATQFHPEKSGRVGLAILKNWTNTIIKA